MELGLINEANNKPEAALCNFQASLEQARRYQNMYPCSEAEEYIAICKSALHEVSEQISGEVGILEFFIAYDENDRPIYAYMSVLPSKYEAYLQAHKSNEKINFEDYGTVLATGWGKTPPEDVRRKMEVEHGVNHSLSEEIGVDVKNLLSTIKSEKNMKAANIKRRFIIMWLSTFIGLYGLTSLVFHMLSPQNSTTETDLFVYGVLMIMGGVISAFLRRKWK